MEENSVGQAPESGPSVNTVLAVMIEQLASIAWQRLGLQSDPFSGKTERDLDQARRAIDAVAAIAPILSSKLDDDDRRQISNLVNDLRANYVNQISQS
ncbi:MAG: DUF1844 domain-containing protein [Fimbriimonadaceae bacterium]